MTYAPPYTTSFLPHAEKTLVTAFARVAAMSRQEAPSEAVGVITAGGSVYPLINDAANPKHSARVHHHNVLVVMGLIARDGDVPLWYYHSHPQGTVELSIEDMTHFSDDIRYTALYSNPDDTLILYHLPKRHTSPVAIVQVRSGVLVPSDVLAPSDVLEGANG